MTAHPRVASPATLAGLGRDQLHELYYYMRLTRSLEERLVNLYRQTKVIGGLFPNDADGNAWGDPNLGLPPALAKACY